MKRPGTVASTGYVLSLSKHRSNLDTRVNGSFRAITAFSAHTNRSCGPVVTRLDARHLPCCHPIGARFRYGIYDCKAQNSALPWVCERLVVLNHVPHILCPQSKDFTLITK